MRSEAEQAGTRSVATVVVLYLMVAGCGLVALPSLLASSARQVGPSSYPPVSAILWTLGAGCLAVVGLVLAPSLDSVVRRAVWRTPWFRTDGPHAVPSATSAWISFPIVAIVNLALAETILRPALVATLGGPISASFTDAAIAVGCLIVLLLLLVRLQTTARPWVEAAAWYALDAIMATSNSEGARRFYDTDQHRTRAVSTQRGDGAGLEVTRRAVDQDATVLADDATVVVPDSDSTDATVPLIEPAAQETLLADRPTERGGR